MTVTTTDRIRIESAEDVAVKTLEQVVAALEAIGLPSMTSVHVETLVGGGSNQNFLVTDQDGSRSVLRLAADISFNERFGLDRWRGMEAHRMAQRVGVAPDLLGITLPVGHSLVAFIEEPVVDETRIRETDVLEACTRTLRTFHQSGSLSGSFCPFVEIQRFRAIADSEGLRLPSDVDHLMDVSERIKNVFDVVMVPGVPCHNDVQLPNFLSGASTWMLDWEYAAWGNPYFDLAMIVSNAELDEARACKMLQTYFGECRPADLARTRLQQVQSALREAMWSVIAKPVLDTTGWDYDGWADLYFEKVRRTISSADWEDVIRTADKQTDDHDFYNSGGQA